METFLLAKMSKLLTVAQEGKMSQFKGKSLEDVSLSMDESLLLPMRKVTLTRTLMTVLMMNVE